MNSVLAQRKLRLVVAQAAATAETIATGPHPISEVRAFQMGSPGSADSYVVLRVRTQSGLAGYGECNSLTAAELKQRIRRYTAEPRPRTRPSMLWCRLSSEAV